MVTVRLSRKGRNKIAIYRVVVMDNRKRRDGAVVDSIGEYNPMTKPATFKVNHERAMYWMGVGAKLSDTVHTLFHRDGVIKKFEMKKKGLDIAAVTVERKQEKGKKSTGSKKKQAKEKAAEAAPAAAPAAQ